MYMYESLFENHCRAVVHLIAFTSMLFRSAGELVTAPRNTESKVGDPTYLNCSTNLSSREIFWYHGRNYIYVGDTTGILDPYRERFGIERNESNGSHNLVIHSVESSDAGEYICIDDDGLGERRSAELIVLDKDPDCQSNMQPDGVIGLNIFDIPHDEVQLVCSITYHGNTPPRMEWKKVGDKNSTQDSVTSNTSSNNRIIYTLNLKVDISLDKSSYVCKTTRSTQHHYKCTSETIKVLYFLDRNITEQNVVRGDEITCATKNNTFSCINQWYIGNNSCPLSCDETITTHLVGEYLCTVKCDVRGTEYNFKALKAVVVEATTSPPPSQSGTIAASVLVPTFIIVPIATVIILWMKRRNAQVKKDEERALILLEDNDQSKDQVMRRLHFEAARTARMWSAEGAQNRSNRERSHDDKVAEEVIELRYTLHTQLEIEAEDAIISGVALLDGRLFIVCKTTHTLQVFECRSINFSPDSKIINVTNLVCAVDICSCKEKKCLYIMDKKAERAAKEVLRIDPEGRLLTSWKTKDSASGYLSTTEQGNVIIAVKYRNMLLEYSHDGNLLRDIKLKEHINPWHAIKLASGYYVVSHGAIYDPLHRVCRVDINGNVQKSFGRNSGSAEDQLNTPNYLAVASNGYVMVANFGNNRVLLLDSELEFKANIVAQNKQEFRCPQRIYVDEGILVVAINASNPKETTAVEEGRQRDEREEGDHSSVNDALLQMTWKMKEYNDAERRPIGEDCLLLVFDIQQLLRK